MDIVGGISARKSSFNNGFLLKEVPAVRDIVKKSINSKPGDLMILFLPRIVIHVPGNRLLSVDDAH